VIRLLTLLFLLVAALPAARVTQSLDGTWEIEDSIAAGSDPPDSLTRFRFPGLANLATPPFPDVDQFDSRELINNKIRRGLMPESARTSATGVPRQNRNYFWYRTSFRAPQRGSVRNPAHQQGAIRHGDLGERPGFRGALGMLHGGSVQR
jgi:hypothetical protein